MYGVEKFLGVSYEGFEQEVAVLFPAIESSCKGHNVMPGSRKETGSRVKGVKELRLSCSINYDSKRNPTNPSSWCCGTAPILL
jgi:hypothetical protein